MLAMEVMGWIVALHAFLQPVPLPADAPVAPEHAAMFVRLQPFEERFVTPNPSE